MRGMYEKGISAVHELLVYVKIEWKFFMVFMIYLECSLKSITKFSVEIGINKRINSTVAVTNPEDNCDDNARCTACFPTYR